MARFKVGDKVRIVYQRYSHEPVGTIVKINFVDPKDDHCPYKAVPESEELRDHDLRWQGLWHLETDVAPLWKATYAKV